MTTWATRLEDALARRHLWQWLKGQSVPSDETNEQPTRVVFNLYKWI